MLDTVEVGMNSEVTFFYMDTLVFIPEAAHNKTTVVWPPASYLTIQA